MKINFSIENEYNQDEIKVLQQIFKLYHEGNLEVELVRETDQLESIIETNGHAIITPYNGVHFDLVLLYFIRDLKRHPQMVIKTNDVASPEFLMAYISNKYRPISYAVVQEEDIDKQIVKLFTVLNNLKPENIKITFDNEISDDFIKRLFDELLDSCLPYFSEQMIDIIKSIIIIDLEIPNVPFRGIVNPGFIKQYLQESTIARQRLNTIYSVFDSIPLFMFCSLNDQEIPEKFNSKPVEIIEVETEDHFTGGILKHLLTDRDFVYFVYHQRQSVENLIPSSYLYYQNKFDGYIYDDLNMFGLLDKHGHFDTLIKGISS